MRHESSSFMERSRFPSPSKRLLRHSSRNQTYRHSRGHLYALITLLLFCTLAIFHSRLSAANASNFARLFVPSVAHRENGASDYAALNPTNIGSRGLAERSLEEAQNTSRSHFVSQGNVEDEETDTEIEADAEVVMEEVLDDDANDNDDKEEDQRQQQQKMKGAKEVERVDITEEHQKSDSVGDGGWHTSLKSSVHRADEMSTSVKDSSVSGKIMSEAAKGGSQPKDFLFRHGGIKTLPRWDPLENIADRGKQANVERGDSTWRSSRLSAIRWDHLLGVVRKIGNCRSSSALLQFRKIKPGDGHFVSASGSSLDDSHIFSSDDMPLNENVRNNLEGVETIEDALLLRTERGKNVNLRSWIDKKLKGDVYKKERSNRSFLESLNPINNPLLQDPDTSNPNGLSGNDRAMLKALRRASAKVSMSQLGNLEAENGNADSASFQRASQDAFGVHRKSQLGSAAERSILEFSNSESFVSSEAVGGRKRDTTSSMSKKLSQSSDFSVKERSMSFSDTKKWGFYPGLDSNLAFSEFLEQFLEDEKCSHKVFMVWTTPSWTYTVRYQRGLESIFYFHPQACVVVFSISIELDFFKSFVEEGFRVAVVVPNLEELLAGTPADVFASFWLPWRKINLFHIHYSELLRLAVLYKYGGIYLDTDIVLLKPIVLHNNTIGAEKVGNEGFELNGAVMAFDKNSIFLLECLLEFTATYDDRLFDFNGARLVTRVANRMANKQNRTSGQFVGDLYIEEAHAFFPLNRDEIIRYFKAPDSREQQLETAQLVESIFNHSRMLHFWNQKTYFLVPEASSLVEKILNRHCIKCNEYL